MILPLRQIALSALASAFVLLLSPNAEAQGISRGTLEKQRNDLVAQRATLQQFEAQAKAGNILLVPSGNGVLPVATDDYRKLQEAKLFVPGDEAQNKAVRARIDADIAGMRQRSTAALQSLTNDLNKDIATINKVIQTSNEVDSDGHRRTDADKIAEDFLSADTSSGSNNKPSPPPKPRKARTDTDRAVDDFLNADTSASPSPRSRNPNNLSPEELAESPAAPDAGSRTLTVDNTPSPPPDGTPIIDASVSPPPTRSGMDGYDDAVDATQAIAGIVAGIAGASNRNNRGRNNNNGGHHGNNNSGGSHPSPRPGGC